MMRVFTILLMMVAISFAWYHKKYHRRNKLLSKIPAYKSYPLIGSSFLFVGKSTVDIFKTLEIASRKIGPVYRMDLSPFSSMVFISDVKFLEGLLSTQKHIDKAPIYDFVREWLGDGEI
jgi:hypothetical protein